MTTQKSTQADSRLIRWLLHESGVSRYRIAKDIGISEATLSRMASETTQLESIRFGSAQKLSAYAEQIQAEHAAETPQQPKGATTDGEDLH